MLPCFRLGLWYRLQNYLQCLFQHRQCFTGGMTLLANQISTYRELGDLDLFLYAIIVIVEQIVTFAERPLDKFRLC